jgi:hypothetical protein
MTQDSKKVDDIMTNVQSITAGDPDMIAKLNEIARRVAEVQGSKPTARDNLNVAADPMDALGCEGCQ